MKIKRQRNTVAAQWAQDNSCSIHKAFLYRNKLKKLVKFDALRKMVYDIDSSTRFYFAIYYFHQCEWLLYGINDHWAFWNPGEVAEFANNELIPYYELDKDFAKQYNLPTAAIQLLRMKKQKVK